MRNRDKALCLGMGAAVLTSVLVWSLPVSAADAPGGLHSRGTVRCENAVMDAADLQSIHAYITEKKNAAAGILQQLGTRFRQQSGEIVPDRNPDAAPGDVDVSSLGWPVLVQAAADSQKVPDGLAVLHPEYAMRIEGVEEYTDRYVTASADNISRGKAAWADGRLLLGNGADNDKAYQAGIRDGAGGRVPDSMLPLFSVQEVSVEIRHVHLGEPLEEEGDSGCYRNTKETKQETRKCGRELEKTEAVWYPNPEEPDGGSWHGGYYTCFMHGGVYDGPGTCQEKKTVTTTVWRHNLICGLEDQVYGRMTVRGTDSDPADGAIVLEAVLEQGEAYEQLAWQGEEQLVWSDDAGNTLGTGTELCVQSPGIYRCSINVANEDIDNREVSASVKVFGLVLRN